MWAPEAYKQAKKPCFIIIKSQKKFVTRNSDMNSANKAIHYNYENYSSINLYSKE